MRNFLLSRLRAALSLAPALLAACSVYDPALVQPRDAGPPDMPVVRRDAGRTDLAKPPPRPTIPDSGDQETVFALKDVRLDQGSTDWASIGFDVDDRLTTLDDLDVECVPPDDSAEPELDGDDGIDNAFGHFVYPLIDVVLPTLEMDFRRSQTLGNGTLITRMTGWNGQDDDPRVNVVIAQSAFGTSAPAADVDPATGQLRAGGAAPAPLWAGDDTFFVRSDAFVAGNEERPRIEDSNAYVSGRKVVLALPAGTEILFLANARSVKVSFTSAVVVGTLSPDASRLERVIVAGRWATSAMLEASGPIGICEGSGEWDIFANALDQRADVRAVAGSGGVGVACDAVSLGVTFEGYRAAWGGLAPAPAAPDCCAGVPGGAGCPP
jgi:hypothetical protein